MSLGANEMARGKTRCEQWLWNMAYAKVKHYHGDNGFFSAEEYCQACFDKGQTQSFFGIGAHYSNNNIHGLLIYGTLLSVLLNRSQIKGWMASCSCYGLLQ